MVLSIIEVSRKQAYIFSSNKLKDNVERSEEIAWVTSSDFFQKCCSQLYDEERNLVYAGGGHTVLCFEVEEEARNFNKSLTQTIANDFPDMEVFAKIMTYNNAASPSENLKELTKALERKKSIRRASFHQGTFGFEKINSTNFKPEKKGAGDNRWRAEIEKREKKTDEALLPSGYKNVRKFEELTFDQGKTNFCAIVHIDGNGMGARINRLYEKLESDDSDWDSFRKKIREFSDQIDDDYKTAYREMLLEVVKLMPDDSKKNLPIRRIVTSGDDICFVADGKIGTEAAKIYIEKLTAIVNSIDGETYAACAGVSITHIKYPFFRSYELAEALCSNAKCQGALLSPEDNGASLSLMDWNISFGELRDSLEEIRKDYLSSEGATLCARPYLIKGNSSKGGIPYNKFSEALSKVACKDDAPARGKIKELRSVLKESEEEIEYYKKFYRLTNLLGIDNAILFDAIEAMDLFYQP